MIVVCFFVRWGTFHVSPNRSSGEVFSSQNWGNLRKQSGVSKAVLARVLPPPVLSRASHTLTPTHGLRAQRIRRTEQVWWHTLPSEQRRPMLAILGYGGEDHFFCRRFLGVVRGHSREWPPPCYFAVVSFHVLVLGIFAKWVCKARPTHVAPNKPLA